MILHLKHLPLQQETAVYTLNRGVPKITLSSSSLFVFPGQTRYHIDFLPHFLHQSVALLTGQCSDTLILSQTKKLSRKATELTAAILCLIQTRLYTGSTRVQGALEVKVEAAVPLAVIKFVLMASSASIYKAETHLILPKTTTRRIVVDARRLLVSSGKRTVSHL